MILTFFFNTIFVLLTLVVGALPVGSLPTAISSSFALFWGYANQFSYVFPIGTLLTAFAVVIGFDIAILGWHFLNWAIRKIPGIS